MLLLCRNLADRFCSGQVGNVRAGAKSVIYYAGADVVAYGACPAVRC